MGVRGRALAVMRLMIRLKSLLPWCICKAFHFPAGTSEASGKCRSAVEAKRQESADLHLPCLFLIQLYLWDAAVSGSPAERQHGCRHVRQQLIPHWPPWLNVSSQSSRSVLQEKVGESYVLNQQKEVGGGPEGYWSLLLAKVFIRQIRCSPGGSLETRKLVTY